MEHPEKEEYANFTIRVSGYAVKFIDLTREQQMDVIYPSLKISTIPFPVSSMIPACHSLATGIPRMFL